MTDVARGWVEGAVPPGGKTPNPINGDGRNQSAPDVESEDESGELDSDELVLASDPGSVFDQSDAEPIVDSPANANGDSIVPGDSAADTPNGSMPADAAARASQPQSRDLPPSEAFREKANRHIHRRLIARCGGRHRATDNPILSMPFTQYREIVQWVAEQVRLDIPSSVEMPAWLHQFLRGMGMDPDRWREAVREFENWFGIAVGSTSPLRELLERTGRRWIHGMRNCRGAFG